jgi:hypothetical protein
MKQEWSHRKDIAGRSRTQDVASEWNIENLRRRKNSAEMTGGDDAESASVAVGQVKMKAKATS